MNKPTRYVGRTHKMCEEAYQQGRADTIKEILIAIDSFNKDIQWSNELQAIRNFVEQLKG